MEKGTKTNKFFKQLKTDKSAIYQLKSDQEFAQETNTVLQTEKKYFKFRTLPEIVLGYAMKESSPEETKKGLFFLFFDFV